MSDLALINWINKRSFAAAMFAQSIHINLVNAGSKPSHKDVADCMTTLLGREYNEVDIRMLMGKSDNPEEQQVLIRVDKLLKAFGGEKALAEDIDANARKLIASGEDPHWIGYIAEYLRQALAYRQQCTKLLDLYNKAMAALPELAERTDLTKVVGYPGNKNQPVEVNEFIDELIDHFRLLDNVFLVAPPEVWPLSNRIVVRTVESEQGPIVTVPTQRGVFVINAAPE